MKNQNANPLNYHVKQVSNTILIADEIKPAPQNTIIDCDGLQMRTEACLGRLM